MDINIHEDTLVALGLEPLAESLWIVVTGPDVVLGGSFGDLLGGVEVSDEDGIL